MALHIPISAKSTVSQERTVGPLMRFLVYTIVLVVGLVSCTAASDSSTEEISASEQTQVDGGVVSADLELARALEAALADRNTSADLVELGEVLYGRGQREAAKVALLHAVERIDNRTPEPLLDRIDGGLAVVALETGDFELSIDATSRALERSANATFRVLRGMSRLASEDIDAALDDFDAAWAEDPASFSAQAFDSYIVALLSSERLEDVLAVSGIRAARYGFRPQDLAVRSNVLSQLGQVELSALVRIARIALFSDYRMEREQIELNAILSSLSADSWARESTTRFAGSGVTAIPAELVETTDAFPEIQILNALWTSEPETSAIGSAVDLEIFSRLSQTYYVRLWQSAAAQSEQYSFTTAQPLLEKAILLNPTTQHAALTREEVRRLLNIDGFDDAPLLLPAEVNERVETALTSGESFAVDPVIAMLALPDNPYVLHAQLVLTQIAALPVFNARLEQALITATGRQAERLRGILR